MARRSLSRWQKASALLPMAVLVAAWGAALTNSGLANASDEVAGVAVPDVPSSPFDQPASVQEAPEGIDPRAGRSMAVNTLSSNGIPAAALSAYRRGATLLGRADESCNLPWTLLAAIGRVESNHGRTNGNALDTEGTAKPGIYGVALDGRDGRARITDTDGGKLDRDPVLDRAVGPMQFIPGTWSSVGVDADGDDAKNPQDIDDAATAAGVYLCAGPGDLTKRSDAAAAVRRYNQSDSYVNLVLEIAERYAAGDFTQSPDGTSTAPMLTNRSTDQTLTQSQRSSWAKSEKKFNAKPKPKPGSSGGTGSGSDGTGSTGGTGAVVPGTGGGTSGGGGTTVGDTPLGPVVKPVTNLLSYTEASAKCKSKYPADRGLLGIDLTYSSGQWAKYKACMADEGH